MPSRVVPLLALVVVSAASAGPALAQDGTGSLSGTVTSDATGAPLAGVCVQASGESASKSTTTGDDGTWTLDGLTPGEHLVSVNICLEPLPGYAGELYEDAASWQDVDPIPVGAGQAVEGIDAALEEAARIRGTVTDDQSGAPLSGICVLAFDEVGSFGQAVTGTDGRYALESLRGGSYQVMFRDCSDPYTYRDEAWDDVPLGPFGPMGETTAVVVADAGTREGVDAALQQGGSVVVTVVGLHHGQPLSNVCVALVEPGGEPDELSAVTFSGYAPDPAGTVRPGEAVFAGVPAGDHSLLANPVEVCGDDGYEPTPVSGGRDVRVVRGQVAEAPDLVLAPRPSTSYACGTDPADPDSPPPFGDVRNQHAPAIECIAAHGITAGRADGTYGPGEVVRRDQMASFLARTLEAAGTELPASPPDAFRDDEGSTHEHAIDQLAALGILSGKAPGRFAPAEGVSRAQTATLLVNAYESATGLTLRAVRDAFSDDEGSVHEDRIDKAAAAGLAAGDGLRFSPGVDVRRDQMASFLARMLDRVQRDLSATALDPGMPAPTDDDATAADRWSPSGLRTATSR